jgi:ABC-type amino acid transport substrate-binding protein
MLVFRRIAALLVLPLFAALVTPGETRAQDSPVLDRVMESGQLRVGMSGTQPPFNARSRGGAVIGLDADLGRLLAGAIGVELEIVTRPFGELLSALEAGEVDMVMSGLSITGGRTRRVSFVGPYMMSGKSILTRSETLSRVQEAGQINRSEIRLTALANSTSEEFVQINLPEAQLVTVVDYDEAIGMLLEGTVDALVADMAIALISIMRHPDAGFVTLEQPLTIEPVGIAVPANDHQFLNLLDNYLDTFEGTGILEQLRKKWLEDGSWIAALP